jgi:CheY-like chemotaxis protein
MLWAPCRSVLEDSLLDSVPPKRILLIDDSEITLQMEKAVLEQRGYQVEATSTLVEFERLLKDFKPDLILTDIHMPEARGTDICRTLKNEYQTQDIPIVLFSSLNDDELADLAQQVGADGFLSKAHGLDALGEKVDELVESIIW